MEAASIVSGQGQQHSWWLRAHCPQWQSWWQQVGALCGGGGGGVCVMVCVCGGGGQAHGSDRGV
jgi:hypothetical protein